MSKQNLPLYKYSTILYLSFSSLSIPALASFIPLDQTNEATIIKAVDRGEIDCLSSWFKQDLSVNWADKKGRSLLQRASARGQKEVAQMLLRRGVEVNFQDPHGHTALYRACQGGYQDLVDLLITQGADVNLATSQGLTPLYWASKKGNLELVTLLCKAKASPTKVTLLKETPLWIAAKEGHLNVVSHLLGYSRSKEKLLHQGDIKGITPLLIACYQGHQEMVAFLLSQGACPNRARDNGVTPLMVASAKGQASIVNTLLQHGAKVSQKASSQVGGGTALDYAKQQNHLELLSLLRGVLRQERQAKKLTKKAQSLLLEPVADNKLPEALAPLEEHFKKVAPSSRLEAWQVEVPVQDIALALSPAEQQALQQADKIVMSYIAKYAQSVEDLSHFSRARKNLSQAFAKTIKVTKDIVLGPNINSLKKFQQKVNKAYGAEVLKLDQVRLEKMHKQRLKDLSFSHQQNQNDLEQQLEELRVQLKVAPHHHIELMQQQEALQKQLADEEQLYQATLKHLQNPVQIALQDFYDWKRTVFNDFTKLYLCNYFITCEALALGTVARHPEAYEQALQGSTAIASILSDAFLPLGGFLGNMVGTVVKTGAALYADRQIRLKSAKIGSLYGYEGLEGMVALSQEVANGLLYRLKDSILELTPESLDKLAKVASIQMIDYALKQWEQDETQTITAAELLLRSTQHQPSWFKSFTQTATLKTEDGRTLDGWILLTQNQQVTLDEGRFMRAAHSFANHARENGEAFIRCVGSAASVVSDFINF